MTLAPATLWMWLPVGYALTVAIETPVLLLGLSPRWTRMQRLGLAAWLTAVTYPIVVVALPLALPPGTSWPVYVAIAEAFAVGTECLLMRRAWQGSWRDVGVVAVANVVSATVGLLAFR
jgi:hypothetical protein